jgi:hypothetical protein
MKQGAQVTSLVPISIVGGELVNISPPLHFSSCFMFLFSPQASPNKSADSLRNRKIFFLAIGRQFHEFVRGNIKIDFLCVSIIPLIPHFGFPPHYSIRVFIT